MNMQLGDIYLINCGTNETSNIINGYRPAVVVKVVYKSSLIHVVPLTTSGKRRLNQMHIKIEGHGLTKPSIALIEQLRLIDKSLLTKQIGSIAGTEQMDQIIRCLVRYFKPDAA